MRTGDWSRTGRGRRGRSRSRRRRTLGERERDGDQARREFLVREPGDEDAAVDVGDVGDRFVRSGSPRCLAPGREHWAARPWRTGRPRAANSSSLPSAPTRRSTGSGVGPAAAGDRQIDIARHRVDRQVVDQDLLGLGPEHGGDLAGHVLDLTGALGAGVRSRGVDREDGGPLGVAHEEDPVGPEAERAGRLDLRFALLQARRRIARHSRRGR